MTIVDGRCEECGRHWGRNYLDSYSFPGSACDMGECICAECEDGAECPRHSVAARARSGNPRYLRIG